MNGNWIGDNLWKILAAIAVGLMAWAVLDSDVDRMKPAIVNNANAIDVVEEEVEAVEKDLIGVKASIEVLGTRQEAYHKDSDTKLDLIQSALDQIPKRNEGP